MSYQNYVVAAYCVFAVVMLWDFVAPRILLRQQMRAAKLHAAKLHVARNASRATPVELK